MKTRLQIQLDHEDYEAVRSWAAMAGVSMSAAIRMLIRDSLGARGDHQQAVERFLAAGGTLTEAAGSDAVSREHDEVLYGPAAP